MTTTTHAEPRNDKSTNGRLPTTDRFAWETLPFHLLGWVAPGVAERRALKRFLTPPPPRAASAKRPPLEGTASDHFRLSVATSIGGIDESMDLDVAMWGRGPAVYLVHGWGGRSSQWSSFVEPLVAAGLSAVVFDAPGHGRSTAPRTSIPHFAAALHAVVDSVGPARAIVGHSMGGAASSLALLRGLHAERVAFIGAPSDPTEIFAAFLQRIGLPTHLHRSIYAKFEREFGVDSRELPVRPPRHGENIPALVVHDRDDREVPYDSAERILRTWPGATLLATEGLGHRRVLRDASVIRHVVAFAAGLEP